MERRIGLHVSIAGGIDKGLERARDLGCRTVQLFSHNPRGWAFGRRDEAEVSRFRELKKDLDITPVYVHTSYLINLASPKQDLFLKSVDMLAAEMTAADEIGAEYVVTHTGSASGDLPATARRRAREALAEVARRGSWKAGLLLENTAGERGDITSQVEDIAWLREKAPQGLIAGICLDTCHAHAAGYDISSGEGIENLVRGLTALLPREEIRLIHLNDSKKPLGSGVDRHEHIGSGTIGQDGLRIFLNHPFFAAIPLILETPKLTDDDDRRNMELVRNLIA